MAIGNSRAVMATRNSEMPSTPRYHEMSSAPNHDLLARELETGVGVAGLERDDHPGDEGELEARGAERQPFGRRCACAAGKRATAKAAPRGRKMITSRMGKLMLSSRSGSVR